MNWFNSCQLRCKKIKCHIPYYMQPEAPWREEELLLLFSELWEIAPRSLGKLYFCEKSSVVVRAEGLYSVKGFCWTNRCILTPLTLGSGRIWSTELELQPHKSYSRLVILQCHKYSVFCLNEWSTQPLTWINTVSLYHIRLSNSVHTLWPTYSTHRNLF